MCYTIVYIVLNVKFQNINMNNVRFQEHFIDIEKGQIKCMNISVRYSFDINFFYLD